MAQARAATPVEPAGLALARRRLAEPSAARGAPLKALGAALLAAVSALGLCAAVFVGASAEPSSAAPPAARHAR